MVITEVAIILFGRVVDKTTIMIATIMEATALVAATEVAIVVVAIIWQPNHCQEQCSLLSLLFLRQLSFIAIRY